MLVTPSWIVVTRPVISSGIARTSTFRVEEGVDQVHGGVRPGWNPRGAGRGWARDRPREARRERRVGMRTCADQFAVGMGNTLTVLVPSPAGAPEPRLVQLGDVALILERGDGGFTSSSSGEPFGIMMPYWSPSRCARRSLRPGSS